MIPNRESLGVWDCKVKSVSIHDLVHLWRAFYQDLISLGNDVGQGRPIGLIKVHTPPH